MPCFEGHPILAAVIDLAMFPLAGLRPGVVEGAHGRVLELGIGTGMNLPFYRDITSLHGVEPDPYMLRRARARTGGLAFPVTFSSDSAEALPFPDASFDSVVATFVFCTFPNPAAAAAEALRVLRPGGQLLFAEHVRSTFRPILASQRAIEPVWQRLAGGCHLTRDTVGLLRVKGAVELQVQPHGAAWSFLPVVTGSALRA